jgi:hypothetical protein
MKKRSTQKHERQKQGVLGRTNRLLSLIRHEPHSKRRAQQFFYCCVCIRYRGDVSTEPLSCNDSGIFTEPLPSNNRRDMQIHTHTQTATWSHKPTLFLLNKESRLKIRGDTQTARRSHNPHFVSKKWKQANKAFYVIQIAVLIPLTRIKVVTKNEKKYIHLHLINSYCNK